MQGLTLRAGRQTDVEALLEVERRAASLLLGHGSHDLFAMHRLAADDLLRGVVDDWLRVAEIDGQIAGFALCGALDGNAHLYEMDVVPEQGRRGIGSALLEASCHLSLQRGCARMTLATLRDVPWNAPFYASRGFVELAEGEWGEGLRGIVARERMLGFPMKLRVVMGRELQLPG